MFGWMHVPNTNNPISNTECFIFLIFESLMPQHNRERERTGEMDDFLNYVQFFRVACSQSVGLVPVLASTEETYLE